ncbi:PLDc N-terminal domain-containing protein [Rothia sp. LK2588]|uniref:PLDc N-terminal domain-containing protein n=1 Tax=Rothia sp. LK2588 TaxID=3114369 RepID=UPI0034CDF99E
MISTTLAATTPASPNLLGWTLTALFFIGLGLALYCVFTIYRNPHFNEIQKLGWLLLTLALPLVGPLAWLIRARAERKHIAAGGAPRNRGPLGASLWDPDDGVHAAANYDLARNNPLNHDSLNLDAAGGSVAAPRPERTRASSWGSAAQNAAGATSRGSSPAHEAETADTAENPYITRNPDGTRGLSF